MGLPAGTYYVVLTVPDGWISTGAWSEAAAANGTVISFHEICVDANPSHYNPPRNIFSTQNFLICKRTPPTGNGATRTQGYWATHLKAMKLAVGQGCIDLGACGPATLGRVEAIMWGNIAKQGTDKRSALGQARMQLGQQLVAAYANWCLLGTSPTGFTLAEATAALNSPDPNVVKSWIDTVGAFNGSGDSIALQGNQTQIVGSATPGDAKATADRTNGYIDPGPCFK